MDNVAVIFPTLNEEEAIREVVELVPEQVLGLETSVFIVDGGSFDSTVSYAEEAGADVIVQDGSGKGDGMRQAIEEIDSDIYVFLDGDGTNPPEEVGKVVEPIVDGDADHVLGNRIKNREKGAFDPLNFYLNRFFSFMVSKSFGMHIKDILTGYRALESSHARELNLETKGFTIETELTLKSWSKGTVKEVPTTYRPRKGESKLSIFSDGLKIAFTFLKQFYSLKLSPKLQFSQSSS